MVVRGEPGGEGMSLSVRMTDGRGDLASLSLGDATAPPASISGPALSLGLGCDSERVIVAWNDRVTAWSADDGRALWTASLDRPLRARRVDSSSGLGVRCRSLSVRKTQVTVPIEGKKKARIRLSDGKVR
jgi:hypothetical protein